ncbi:class I SAM-dependent methyltransferase [Streptomyces sp. 4F14]|uniref:class I SAM-dependent methyltransferase n=1 Tax=Streptomyces sp. 4F14 TaxID=3394380 RepID=UPI003A896A1A
MRPPAQHLGWEAHFAAGHGFRGVGEDELRWLMGALDGITPRRALDVGCGLGTYAAALTSLGWDTLAVDWAESAVACLAGRSGW